MLVLVGTGAVVNRASSIYKWRLQMKVSKLLTTVLVGGMLTTGCVSHKYQVYFEPGSAQLSAKSRTVIMKAAKTIKKNKHSSVSLSGHTDGTGSSRTNKIIAEKRINAVDSMLNNYGVSDDRITTSGRKWLFHREKGGDKSQRRVDIRVRNW